MIKRLIKYRLPFIIIVLVFAVIFLESPFHYYYYSDPPILSCFLITFTNLFVYLIETDKLIFIEKTVYSIILSCVVLIFGGMFVGTIMGFIYGYDSNWDELKSPALLDTTLFYFVTSFGGIGILKIWLGYRKPIYE